MSLHSINKNNHGGRGDTKSWPGAGGQWNLLNHSVGIYNQRMGTTAGWETAAGGMAFKLHFKLYFLFSFLLNPQMNQDKSQLLVVWL